MAYCNFAGKFMESEEETSLDSDSSSDDESDENSIGGKQKNVKKVFL